MRRLRTPEKFVNEDFDFRADTAAKEIQPRWKRCVQATDRVLRRSTRPSLCAKVFLPEARPRLEIGSQPDRRAAPMICRRSLDGTEHGASSAKLAAFAVKNGYTDKWRDIRR